MKVRRSILFVSASTYPEDTPYQVWFDLNNLLTRYKEDLFLKLLIWKNRKFPYEKLFFFLGKLYKKFFLLYTFITLVIFHAKCGSLWTTPWPDKNSVFLKIEKSKKSIFPIEIRTFYLWKLGGAFFLSQRLPTLRILHTKFGLIWTTSWPDIKRPIFKTTYLKKSQFSVRKTIFFPRQAIQKVLFALHFHYTSDSPCQVWFNLNNSLTR